MKLHMQSRCGLVTGCWAKAKSSLPANFILEGLWQTLGHSSVLPTHPLFALSLVSHGRLLIGNRSGLGHLSNAGELGSHTSVCFFICQIIKFLLAFPLGSSLEGFSYLGFLPIRSVPLIKEPAVYLPLGRTCPVTFISHVAFLSHLCMRAT